MWRGLLFTLVWGILSEMGGAQPSCPSYVPLSQPCGISGTVTDELIIVGHNGTGPCCNTEGEPGVQSGDCYDNLLVCDQSLYVPVENRISPAISNNVFNNPISYSMMLQAVQLHIDPSVAGKIGGVLCYDRMGITSDGCDCLCGILVAYEYMMGLTNCKCVNLVTAP